MEQKTTRRQKPRTGRWVALIGFFVLLVFGGTYYFVRAHNQDATASVASDGHGKVNIMVMGVDERADDVGRSDTLLVFTIDRDAKTVSLISVPRDTWVSITGHGYDKINHAYAYGGHALSQKAVENLLGIKIDYYVQVGFKGFMKIIDAIGGVTIDVPKRMYYVDAWDDDGGLEINIQPGSQRMDGKQAIQFVRYRDEEGDIGRVARQQLFLKALLKEISQPGIITRIPSLVRELSSAVKTNLSTPDMLSIGKILHDAYQNGLKAHTVEGTPMYIGGVSYWMPNAIDVRKMVAETQDKVFDGNAQREARLLASTYDQALARYQGVRDFSASPSNQAGQATHAADNKPVSPSSSVPSKQATTKPTSDPKPTDKKPDTPAGSGGAKDATTQGSSPTSSPNVTIKKIQP